MTESVAAILPLPVPGYVRVCNARVDMDPEGQPEPGETVLLVDRTHPVLGNRHILHRRNDPKARAAVIAAYAADLAADEAVQGPMSQAIDAVAQQVLAGHKVCLVCHCKPSACHADVLADRIQARVAQWSTPEPDASVPRRPHP